MPGQVSVETSPYATPLWILVAGIDNGRDSKRLPYPTSSVSRSKLTKRGKTHIDESSLDNPDPGTFLSRNTVTTRDDPNVALDYATKPIERGPGLELGVSIRVLEPIYTCLGRFEEAVPVLEWAIEAPVVGNGSDHALAKISGCIHPDQSIKCYDSGLRIPIEALGDSDPGVVETGRYLAEGRLQAMQFDEAQNLCQKALEINKAYCEPVYLEDTADHWLMAFVCDAKADNEYALERLVLASMSVIANGEENESATIVVGIGNIYLFLCGFDESVFPYQKALAVFKSTEGKNQPSVASVYIRLIDLYYKTCKVRESKFYFENALRIISKPVPGTTSDEIVSRLTEELGIYEGLNEPEEALKLLENAMKLLDDTDGNRSTIAGIEAPKIVTLYLVGRYGEARSSFKSAVGKLHASGENKSAFLGIVLNQMGLVNVQLYRIEEVIELFKNARKILEQECDSYHLETLGVYSYLAATYDAMERMQLRYWSIFLGLEKKLGTKNPEVDDASPAPGRRRKETNQKGKSLEYLLDTNSCGTRKSTKR